MSWRRLLVLCAALGVLVAAGAGLFVAAHTYPALPDAGPRPQASPELIARGAYLARAADCQACHNSEDGPAYAGGRPFALPFGVIYSTNLTPDRETGIGAWSDEAFIRALRQGISKNGRHLYPAMPYADYTGVSDADALAIKAYLFSLEPVRAPTPASGLGFPFNQRWGVSFWNALFVKDQRFKPDPARSAEWNRGAYLATSLGHCGQCHTPRNLAYGLKREALAGAPIEGWRAYNITSDPRYGIGGWSEAELTEYLSRGWTETRGAAGGPMAEVVEHSTSYLTAADMRALITYLKSVKPQASGFTIEASPAAARRQALFAPADEDLRLGQRLYAGACAGCHGYGGRADVNGATLIGTPGVNDPEPMSAVQAILRGVDYRTPSGSVHMPAFGDRYSDAEVAALVRYVGASFGRPNAVEASDVARARRAR